MRTLSSCGLPYIICPMLAFHHVSFKVVISEKNETEVKRPGRLWRQSFFKKPFIFVSFYITFFSFPVSLPFFFFFCPGCATCRILVPWPGIKPRLPAVRVPNPNHWTTRDSLLFIFFYLPPPIFCIIFSNIIYLAVVKHSAPKKLLPPGIGIW